jgi:hypothetical protein
MKFPKSVKPSTKFFSVFRDYLYFDTTDIPLRKITPIITNIKNESFPMDLLFYYPEWIKETSPTVGGCLYLGFDQYAIYWNYPALPSETYHANQINFIPKSVYIPNILSVKYFSINYGYDVEELRNALPYNIENTDRLNTTYFIEPFPNQKMFVPNPYIFHNFINNCYEQQGTIESVSRNTQTDNKNIKCSTKVNVYRVDKETSKIIEGDQYKLGECLTSYLFSLVTNADSINISDCPNFDILYPFGYIKMQVPSSVYDENPEQCVTRPDIDIEYWSVSSNICSSQADLILPFWTVNAQMLYNFSSDVGYILWAPNEEVKKHMTHPRQSIPPIISLNNGRKAYLLQTPTFSFVFRYRNASITWKGNPFYAPCCDTFKETLQKGAITNEMIDSQGINQAPEVFAIDATSVDDLISKIVI